MSYLMSYRNQLNIRIRDQFKPNLDLIVILM